MTNIQKIPFYQKPVWLGELFKINGKQTEKPVHFSIRRLTSKDSAAMGDLSDNIYAHLQRGQECFIHKRSKSDYDKEFHDENIHYIGIFADKTLIGMSYMRICHDEASFFKEIPNSPVTFFNRTSGVKIAAFGADCVLPAYRGNKLNQIMISYRLELANALGCSDAASIVDRNNHWNMPPYFNNGFNMYATGIDPDDGGKIALMHHNLTAENTPLQTRHSVSYQNFGDIDNLLRQGFIGVGYDKQTDKILFAPQKQPHLPEQEKNNSLFSLPKRVVRFSNTPFLTILQSHQVQRA